MRTIVFVADGTGVIDATVFEDAEGSVYDGGLTVSDQEQSVMRIYNAGDWTRMEVQA